MLRRGALTSLVSVGFRSRDSWTDCLCSNTLLCRTLFSFLPKHTHTHTHTHTPSAVCFSPLSPHNPSSSSSSSSSLLIHTSSTSFKNASRFPSLFPTCPVYCLPVSLFSSSLPRPHLSSSPLLFTLLFPFPLFTQSHLCLGISLFSHIPSSPLSPPLFFLSYWLPSSPSPCCSPPSSNPPTRSTSRLTRLSFSSAVDVSLPALGREGGWGGSPGGPAAPFLHL